MRTQINRLWTREELGHSTVVACTMAQRSMFTLNNGRSIPQLAFGTWQAPSGVVGAAVERAILAGFRHIDCARIYQNEKEIGNSLRKLFDEGVVKREDLFLTSKLWNTDHDPPDVERACKASIADLQCGYLDLYLIHWPVAWRASSQTDLFPKNASGGCFQSDISLSATWSAMEGLVELGLTKSIGVSNFSGTQLREIIECGKVRPAVNQVEMHPALPQNELRVIHAELDVLTEAYCPLGIGFQTDATKGVHNDPRIVEIAKQADVTSGAALCLQWGIQQGVVVITKSVTPQRIEVNAATPLAGLTEATMHAIKKYGVAHPHRAVNPLHMGVEIGPFFNDSNKSCVVPLEGGARGRAN